MSLKLLFIDKQTLRFPTCIQVIDCRTVAGLLPVYTCGFSTIDISSFTHLHALQITTHPIYAQNITQEVRYSKLLLPHKTTRSSTINTPIVPHPRRQKYGTHLGKKTIAELNSYPRFKSANKQPSTPTISVSCTTTNPFIDYDAITLVQKHTQLSNLDMSSPVPTRKSTFIGQALQYYKVVQI